MNILNLHKSKLKTATIISNRPSKGNFPQLTDEFECKSEIKLIFLNILMIKTNDPPPPKKILGVLFTNISSLGKWGFNCTPIQTENCTMFKMGVPYWHGMKDKNCSTS